MTDPAAPRRARPPELTVTPDESGMKLLRFLERRLAGDLPKSMLHKWIRTGQVRVNKGRSAPHRQLEQGDSVRVPPFADPRACHGQPGPQPATGTPPTAADASSPSAPFAAQSQAPAAPSCPAPERPLCLGADLPVIAREKEYLVLAKPGGLAVHPGTGIADSLTARLEKAFAGHAFVPAPAHRLDRHTSGLLLAGSSHQGQAWLHQCFAAGTISKEYLAWTAGAWPWEKPMLLCDDLRHFRDAGGRASLQTMPRGLTLNLDDTAEQTQPVEQTEAHDLSDSALCIAVPVQRLGRHDLPGSLRTPKGAALLLILLLTGRKHQIRIQTAARRHPVIGDGRYGGPSFSGMLLHAYALQLPPYPGLPDRPGRKPEARAYLSLPAWQAPFTPDREALTLARQALRRAMCQAHLPGFDKKTFLR